MRRVLALAAILLLPLSATALTEQRGFALSGPGGYYGLVEQTSCMSFNGRTPEVSTRVLLGPVSFRLPYRIATLGAVALLMTAVALVTAPRVQLALARWAKRPITPS